MKVKILSIQKLTLKDGGTLNRYFAICPDNSVGNFYSGYDFKENDEVEFIITIDKECKFVARPVIPRQ